MLEWFYAKPKWILNCKYCFIVGDQCPNVSVFDYTSFKKYICGQKISNRKHHMPNIPALIVKAPFKSCK